MRLCKWLSVLSMCLIGVAHADIRVGIDLSTTGPAAAIGIPSRNTVQMWPQTLGGQRALMAAPDIRQIDDDSDIARESAIRQDPRRPPVEHMAVFAIGSEYPVLQLETLAGRHAIRVIPPLEFQIVRVNHP